MTAQPVSYHPDTDTMYVEIVAGTTAFGRDAATDLVLHMSDDGRVMGYEIEHASRHPEHVAAALAALRAARGIADAAE